MIEDELGPPWSEEEIDIFFAENALYYEHVCRVYSLSACLRR
jgi:hypothetical protein